jgi:cellulose synthase/poly-beta-1,6-N-acetylglucosamine synthase-like glycosyltransferase
LTRAGLVSAGALAAGVRGHRRTGASLSDTLVSEGHVRADHVAQALAREHGLAVFDPATLPDAPFADDQDEEWYCARRLVPLGAREGMFQVATADPTNASLLEEVRQRVGLPVQPLVATNRDIEHALHAQHARRDLYHSTSRLAEQSPGESARSALSGPQKLVAAGSLAGCGVALLLNWSLTLTILTAGVMLVHLATSAYKLYLVNRGWRAVQSCAAPDDAPAEQDERTLPVYTVLVPLYREVAVLPQLRRALDDLDWPKAKLDVRMLLEEDDVETLRAARAANLPAYMTLIVVPKGEPRGKPRACNYGLAHARGEYVVIFDAEDIPEPDQLRRVYAAFQAADPDLGCVQCRLNFYNPTQNLLTRWFTAEYSLLFDLLLPGLQSANLPVPLGGTSNHFRRSVLEQLGAWDPYNVTEDADLGVRMAKRGLRTIVLDSTTYEEANPEIGNWLRQRSRWVKGYIQTWLVHMRHPLALWRALGPRGFWGFQFMIGGTCLVLLLNPLCWALGLLWLTAHTTVIDRVFSGPSFYLGGLALYVGNVSFVYLYIAGMIARGHHGLVKYALLSPLYWVLMSAGAWKGALQLVYRRHYWEKTRHGLAGVAEAREASAPLGGTRALRPEARDQRCR